MHADPVTEAWAVEPLPVLPRTSDLCADWPRDGLDPFDVTDRRTQRMMLASRRLTRAWPASEGASPTSDERGAYKAVPMGYTTLSLLEKLAVVHRGRVIAEWPRCPASPSDPARPLQLAVRCQRSTQVRHANDYRGALDLALALSATSALGDEPIMVVDVLTTEPWH
ncbi:hypothetical protein [Couchioplanes azureus]|uniref:hypothetical protein n=1 Tax=Couchioplanes caeruleus TaxID=56438 RepID=UPI00167156EE|nr:hypothetical protein [Couchioplanes caeruleus]GGQ83314.1 hypothetical protein GCM10010166_62000 [Couchioplanes caeruleus subsp. azureus]